MHAAEDVAAELVRSERVVASDGAASGGEVLRERDRAGAISGAKIAITIQATAITSPTIASGWRQAAVMRGRRQRARGSGATPTLTSPGSVGR